MLMLDQAHLPSYKATTETVVVVAAATMSSPDFGCSNHCTDTLCFEPKANEG